MKQTLNLVLLFARPLYIINLFFSILALICVYNGGALGVTPSILIKLVGYIAVIAYQNYMHAQAYDYFRNNGYQVRKLYLFVFLADFLIYLVPAITLLCTRNVKG